MTALKTELRDMIRAEGPISVERYMSLCLQHPRHGYYTTQESIGRSGDFITAPEVDQMFGELLGLWAAQLWLDLGAPHLLRLVELGPGRGTLMADALRATRVVPGFLEAAWVELVETSPRLEAMQRDKLAEAAPHIAWHRTIEALPEGPAILLANEFFDALPVRHFVRAPDGWHERVVGLDAAGDLCFGAAPEPLPVDATAAQPGDILEIGHVGVRMMRTLAQRLVAQGGALLVCDYGHVQSALGETLQAMKGHAFADVLATPGEADLTAHVDFAALARAAEEMGAKAWGPVPQGEFLTRLGIIQRADALKARADARQRETIDAAIQRFTAPDSTMATLFKVLVVTPADAAPPPGFEED